MTMPQYSGRCGSKHSRPTRSASRKYGCEQFHITCADRGLQRKQKAGTFGEGIIETFDIVDSIKNTYLRHHKEKTLIHVENVAVTAVWLAEKNHLDPEKIRIAALLHDISVIISPQEMYDTVKERGLPIDPAEEKHHFLLHQRVSRIIAEEQFAVRDKTILDAIECHTTLKKNAGPYDKTVFIADKISWDQDEVPPWHDPLRILAEESLDRACYFYINYQFEHQLLLMPHQWIIEAYEDLKGKPGPVL